MKSNMNGYIMVPMSSFCESSYRYHNYMCMNILNSGLQYKGLYIISLHDSHKDIGNSS